MRLKFRIWKGGHFESMGFIHDDPCKFHCNDYKIAPDCITQFTGLKDKNGEEIYAGDIVKYAVSRDYEGTLNYEIAPVEFKSGGFIPVFFAYWEIMHDFDDKPQIYTDIEVIGNIYSNPELLK